MSTFLRSPDLGEKIEIERLMACDRGHFFSADTMKSFRSIAYPEVFVAPAGWYFVTSERDRYSDEPREWTARVMYGAHMDYHITSISELPKFTSKRAALRAIKNILKGK